MPTTGWSTPGLHVASIERSIEFYGRLGFRVIDVDRGEDGVIGWARMHCEGGALMFLRQEEPPTEPPHDRIFFYLYTDDLPALREELLAAGVEAAEITHPWYMPSGELCLKDPDGHGLFVGHWGDSEHQKWLESLENKRAAGLIP